MNSVIENNREWIDKTWEKVDKKLQRVAVKSRNKLPSMTINGTHDDQYSQGHAEWWTNGFWGGMMWIMYNLTKNEEYRITAENCEKLMDEALKNYKHLHHDVGFMWQLTSGANYRLTGNEASYTKNLFLAATLSARYNIKGGYIRAWNSEELGNFTIIDTMMNLPLLYWASREIEDPRFKHVAEAHVDMVLREHMREDGSVNHVVEHSPETGEVVRVVDGVTVIDQETGKSKFVMVCQGYSPESSWTRGLGWAIYGLVLSHIHTGKKEYLDAAVKSANYFIANSIPYNFLTPIDFRAPKEPLLYDSTAGVCVACGLLELAKLVSKPEAEMYADAAIKILKATDKHFCDYSEEEDGLVMMGSAAYPHDKNELVHTNLIYGDFFYVEALAKLKGSDFLIW